MASLLEIIDEIGISGLLDIIFMSVLIYSLLVWFKRTRMVFVVTGMFIVAAAYLIARQLDLSLTTTVFQGFFAITLIAVVIIFQEEIKRFFEQIASRSFLSRSRRGRLIAIPQKEIEVLVTTVNGLAREHIGALIVLRGKDPIARHLEGGTTLDGEISDALLRSIFDPHSLGHDGAVVIRNNRVFQFACHLPLSKNLRKLKRTGTRHAAALGLSELSDALCIVVSEEEGTISIARHGDIRYAQDQEELSTIIDSFFEEVRPQQNNRQFKDFFKKNYREKGIALGVTLFLWFFFVHEARIDIQNYQLPLTYSNLPPEVEVKELHPKSVEITFSGPRRAFYFVKTRNIEVSLKLYDVQEGINRKPITRSNITVPEGITLENIHPNEAMIRIVSISKTADTSKVVSKPELR